MPKYTTLRLTYTELLGLLDSVEGVFPELRTQEENQILDRLNKRINKAIYRLESN